jgi:hypothetical protein
MPKNQGAKTAVAVESGCLYQKLGAKTKEINFLEKGPAVKDAAADLD